MLEMAWHHWYTEVTCHSIVEAHTTCSWGTWTPYAVDDTAAYAEVAFVEVLLCQDHGPYRRLRCRQMLLAYAVQPADGGYSSCRLGMVFGVWCRPIPRLPHARWTRTPIAEDFAIEEWQSSLIAKLARSLPLS